MQNFCKMAIYQQKRKNVFAFGRLERIKLEKAEYRNSVRSRRLICDALLELLEEKPLEKITVTDIAKRADVNRGTFYRHYDSVNDVISELQDALIEQMDQYFASLDAPLDADNIMIVTAGCLKIIYEQNRSRYVPLLLHQQLYFADKVSKRFQARFLTAKNIPGDEYSRKELLVRANLLAHGVVGVFYAAANGTLDVPTDSVFHYVDNLVADMQEVQAQKKKRNGENR